MGFAYSNNGLSFRAWNQPSNLLSGEVYFAATPTTAQLTSSFAGHTSAVAAVAAQATFDAAIAAGITITSTGTPALNGTYAIDAASQQNISGIATGIASRSRLPGGGSTFNYGDQSGALHAFSSTNFLDFAAAVEDYCYALDQTLATIAGGGSASWPSASATIT